MNNLYKQTELAYENRSFRDRESNHGPPAFRADVLTITPLLHHVTEVELYGIQFWEC